MMPNLRARSAIYVSAPAALALLGCVPPSQRPDLATENAALKRRIGELEQRADRWRNQTALLEQQVENLQAFAPEQPADLFAPVRIEISSISRGADTDGRPGDDGVTVYVRPLDADGDAVKAPGIIEVEVVDNANLGTPRVLGHCRYDDPEKIRRMWHGKFLTDHYAVSCPFLPEAEPPDRPEVLVTVQFTDFLTGQVLTASRAIPVNLPEPAAP